MNDYVVQNCHWLGKMDKKKYKEGPVFGYACTTLPTAYAHEIILAIQMYLCHTVGWKMNLISMSDI